MMSKRYYTRLDHVITVVDRWVSTFVPKSVVATCNYPPEDIDCQQSILTVAEQQQSRSLMRVNHAGEVSAQALYKAQALVARDEQLYKMAKQAAADEVDHLIWCQRRLRELGGHTSRLNPFWFLGSFGIGLLAGWCGDKWSLAFVAETERQVCAHLNRHLTIISINDVCSRAVLQQMCQDEAEHANVACAAGAVDLPKPVKNLMSLWSKVMTSTAYWI